MHRDRDWFVSSQSNSIFRLQPGSTDMTKVERIHEESNLATNVTDSTPWILYCNQLLELIVYGGASGILSVKPGEPVLIIF